MDGDDQRPEPIQSVITQDLAAEDNVKLSVKGIKIVFSKVGFYLVNIFIVYSLEITCQIGFANFWSLHMKGKTENKTWISNNAFIVMQFAYQIGVFISRSSLQCFII